MQIFFPGGIFCKVFSLGGGGREFDHIKKIPRGMPQGRQGLHA